MDEIDVLFLEDKLLLVLPHTPPQTAPVLLALMHMPPHPSCDTGEVQSPGTALGSYEIKQHSYLFASWLWNLGVGLCILHVGDVGGRDR